MSTTYHTDIAVGAAANASVFNAPLGTLDSAIVTNTTSIAGLSATITTLQNSIILGGAAVTLTNGAASAGQKVVTVDSSAQFVAGCYVEYTLVGGVVERNTVDTVDSSTQITLITNIGTGGIADNSPVAVIPVGFYNSESGTYHVANYGAVGDGATDDTAAIAAALVAIRARDAGKVKSAVLRLTPGANYLVTNSLNMTDIADVTIDGGAVETRITYADADATAAERVLFDCLGSARLTFRNFTVYGDATNIPATFFSLGRSTDVNGLDSGNHIFDHVVCQGYWTVAAIYNVSSELMKLTNVWIIPTGPTGCKYGVFASGTNDESIGSEYATRYSAGSPTMACVWIQNFNIGSGVTPTAYVPIKFGPEAGSLTIRDGYAYTYDDKPIIETTGNTYDLLIQNVLCEGAVDKTIHFSGTGTVYGVTIDGCNLGEYATTGVYQEATATVRGLTIQNTRGSVRSSSPQESAMTFAGAVYSANIGKWWNAEIGTLTFDDLFYSRLAIANHTLTLTGSYKAYGTEISSYSTGGHQYTHFDTAVRVGVVGATNLAEINDMRTASKSWPPGPIGDNAQAETTVTVAGVTKADPWFCMAHYAGIAGSAGWEISAVADDGVVGVIITNRTGGSLTPTGTLSVVAWKITAA